MKVKNSVIKSRVGSKATDNYSQTTGGRAKVAGIIENRSTTASEWPVIDIDFPIIYSNGQCFRKMTPLGWEWPFFRVIFGQK